MKWRWTLLSSLVAVPIAALTWLGLDLAPNIFQWLDILGSLTIRAVAAYLFVRFDSDGSAMLHSFVWGCLTRALSTICLSAFSVPDEWHTVMGVPEMGLPDLRPVLIGWDSAGGIRHWSTFGVDAAFVYLIMIPSLFASGAWQISFSWAAEKIRDRNAMRRS